MKLIDQWGDPITSASATAECGFQGSASSGSSGYEGAQNTGVRDSFVAFPTNPRRELNSHTRKELQRKVRALTANLPLFNRIHTKIGQHAVGKGIFVRPLTKDKDWNDDNRRRYENRVCNPLVYSIDASCDLYEDQRYFAENLPGDGEVLEAFVRSENGAPMVQRLDPFECENPIGPLRLRKDARWQDGVLTNKYGRPIAYNIRELPDADWFEAAKALRSTDREIAVDSMVHVYKHRRALQTRGIPWAFNGVNDGIDALDLKALIKGKAKLHSALAIGIRKQKAESGKKGIADELKKVLGTDGQVTRVDEKFWRGASIQYLATDEGIDLLSSDCPGDNLTAFIEMLYGEIAIGYGIPKSTVYKLDGSGAIVRGDLEDMQWCCDCVQDTIVMRQSQRHYVWDTAIAIKTGKIRPCKDPEWWAAAWRGPAKLTVDLGRTADAAIKLIKNGALSHVRYYEERAQDAYEEAEEQIQFLQWLKKRCEESGVPIEQLIEPTPGAVNNVSVHTQNENA